MRAAITILLACLTAGCATRGYQRAEQTVQSLQATRAELDAADQQVVRTITTLGRIASLAGENPAPEYAQLCKDVKAIEDQAGLARQRADAYREDAEAYVDAWQKELDRMQGGVFMRSAMERSMVMAQFRQIEQLAAGTRQAYGPLIIELQGILRDLGRDLTPAGVAAVNPQIARSREIAMVLRERMAVLIQGLDVVSATLLSQRP